MVRLVRLRSGVPGGTRGARAGRSGPRLRDRRYRLPDAGRARLTGPRRPSRLRNASRAVSSAGEHSLHTRGVVGSNPIPPTTEIASQTQPPSALIRSRRRSWRKWQPIGDEATPGATFAPGVLAGAGGWRRAGAGELCVVMQAAPGRRWGGGFRGSEAPYEGGHRGRESTSHAAGGVVPGGGARQLFPRCGPRQVVASVRGDLSCTPCARHLWPSSPSRVLLAMQSFQRVGGAFGSPWS